MQSPPILGGVPTGGVVNTESICLMKSSSTSSVFACLPSYNLRKRSVRGQNAEEALPAIETADSPTSHRTSGLDVLTDLYESAAIPRFGIALTPDPVP